MSRSDEVKTLDWSLTGPRQKLGLPRRLSEERVEEEESLEMERSLKTLLRGRLPFLLLNVHQLVLLVLMKFRLLLAPAGSAPQISRNGLRQELVRSPERRELAI